MTFGCINCAKKVLLSVLWYFTPYSHALCNMQQLGNGMHTCCAGMCTQCSPALFKFTEQNI